MRSGAYRDYYDRQYAARLRRRSEPMSTDELRGVVLAGGTGSRLFPLTKVTNKHLLPVGREPMIFHPVRKLVEAGIREILIVTGTEHMGDVVGLLGSGKDFGCEFTYRVQDEAGGIAQALGLARRFGRGGRLAVILGDNIFEGSIAPFAEALPAAADAARKVLVQEVDDPGRYGVAEIEGDRVVRIVEKPKQPVSRLAVTGIYFYDETRSRGDRGPEAVRARRAGDHRRQQRLHRARRSDLRRAARLVDRRRHVRVARPRQRIAEGREVAGAPLRAPARVLSSGGRPCDICGSWLTVGLENWRSDWVNGSSAGKPFRPPARSCPGVTSWRGARSTRRGCCAKSCGRWRIPSNPPPPGSRGAVALSLHRDLIYWMLVAGGHSPEGTPDLAALWQQAPRDKLLRAAGGEEKLASVQRLLIGLSPPASLDAGDEDVGHVQAFADALYGDLVAPRRRVARLVAWRWLRLAAAATAVVAVVLVVRTATMGPNLAAKAKMMVSSRLPECAGDPGCADLLFHTNQENGPWVEFDLGAPVPIHVIEVHNRPDCCQDRAVPLVAEISTDHVGWREVGHRDKEFSSWTAKFPRTVARYVRLRVPRHTYFGFEGVAIR